MIHFVYNRFPLKKLNELLKETKEISSNYSDNFPVDIAKPLLIIDQVGKNTINIFNETNGSKIKASTFHAKLKDKDIEINPEDYELLYQNYIAINEENGERYYSLSINNVITE